MIVLKALELRKPSSLCTKLTGGFIDWSHFIILGRNFYMLNSWRDLTIDFNTKAVLFRNPPQWVCSHSIPKRLNYRSESISPLNKTWTVNRTAIQIVSGSRNTSRAMTFEKASCCCIAGVFSWSSFKSQWAKVNTYKLFTGKGIFCPPRERWW